MVWSKLGQIIWSEKVFEYLFGTWSLFTQKFNCIFQSVLFDNYKHYESILIELFFTLGVIHQSGSSDTLVFQKMKNFDMETTVKIELHPVWQKIKILFCKKSDAKKEKMSKSIFWPVNGLCSTCLLAKLYNKPVS